jgi:hypothetical protein
MIVISSSLEGCHVPIPSVHETLVDLFVHPSAKVILSLYPKKVENHHEAGAIFLTLDGGGFGLWTTYEELALAMFEARIILLKVEKRND